MGKANWEGCWPRFQKAGRHAEASSAVLPGHVGDGLSFRARGGRLPRVGEAESRSEGTRPARLGVSLRVGSAPARAARLSKFMENSSEVLVTAFRGTQTCHFSKRSSW